MKIYCTSVYPHTTKVSMTRQMPQITCEEKKTKREIISLYSDLDSFGTDNLSLDSLSLSITHASKGWISKGKVDQNEVKCEEKEKRNIENQKFTHINTLFIHDIHSCFFFSTGMDKAVTLSCGGRMPLVGLGCWEVGAKLSKSFKYSTLPYSFFYLCFKSPFQAVSCQLSQVDPGDISLLIWMFTLFNFTSLLWHDLLRLNPLLAV